MNKRKGLKRLAIALGVPYFGFWALLGWISQTGVDQYEAEIRAALLANDSTTLSTYVALRNKTIDQLHLSITWGIVVPLVVLIVAAVAYWVYRGFRPRDED